MSGSGLFPLLLLYVLGTGEGSAAPLTFGRPTSDDGKVVRGLLLLLYLQKRIDLVIRYYLRIQSLPFPKQKKHEIVTYREKAEALE